MSNSSNITDDFYSLREDYSSSFSNNNNPANSWNFDDDTVTSTKHTFGWFDNLLQNSTAANEGQLTPAQDVNPDNVLATLLLNMVVCVFLLGLYEVLRRYIPSVYSQRLVYGGRGLGSNVNMSVGSVEVSRLGYSAVTLNKDSSAATAAGQQQQQQQERLEDQKTLNSSASVNSVKASCTTCTKALPILEWATPIHSTPWSTIRQLAGLDAYFFLRYIRMCLKITSVSSFWGMILLWPVYATGSGGQVGFYHFSMANVGVDEKGRVWVPTFFCWAFTMYCWFCVRSEMEHYGELRMQFLGAGEGEEEKAQLSMSSRDQSQQREEDNNVVGKGNVALTKENRIVSEIPSDNKEESTVPDVQSLSPRSSSPLLPEDGPDDAAAALRCHSFGESSGVDVRHVDSNNSRHTKQHRYSLEVEKIPVALRSNTALYNYFNDMFPGQVHSVCVAMNVPDLEALSVRRLRVARRLEKSLAYYYATGMRPTHVTGRPRMQCCGIESTPIDGMCLVCCCCYDSCQMGAHHDDEDNCPEHITDQLPNRGECVDSISYYTLDLALCNMRLKKMQEAKMQVAETGLSFSPTDEEGKSTVKWYKSLGWMNKAAGTIRDEFEVVTEEDELTEGKVFKAYGTASEKRAPLVHGDHLSSRGNSAPRRRLSKPRMWMRALLWRMGLDFLAAGLDEVQDRTNVVVDSVTRPSMSSTGFVTFKTITPVTVSTSAPLTYNGIPMEVSVAPETRDIVWKNVQIDRDVSTGKEFIANVLLGLGVLLWSIPLTLIQAWAKVENVAKIPGLDWIEDIHGGQYRALINGYLPVITLLGLILLLPIIFKAVAESYEKRKTFSGVEDSIAGRRSPQMML
eukprot:scaffold23368_cov71-Cyclotella_meneghiniana.AAC.7